MSGGRNTQESPSFKHVEDQCFLQHFSSILGVPPLSLSRINHAGVNVAPKNREGLRPFLDMCQFFPHFLFSREQKRQIFPTLQGKYTICRVENGIPSNICVAYFPLWKIRSEREARFLAQVKKKEEEDEG